MRASSPSVVSCALQLNVWCSYCACSCAFSQAFQYSYLRHISVCFPRFETPNCTVAVAVGYYFLFNSNFRNLGISQVNRNLYLDLGLSLVILCEAKQINTLDLVVFWWTIHRWLFLLMNHPLMKHPRNVMPQFAHFTEVSHNRLWIFAVWTTLTSGKDKNCN